MVFSYAYFEHISGMLGTHRPKYSKITNSSISRRRHLFPQTNAKRTSMKSYPKPYFQHFRHIIITPIEYGFYFLAKLSNSFLTTRNVLQVSNDSPET